MSRVVFTPHGKKVRHSQEWQPPPPRSPPTKSEQQCQECLLSPHELNGNNTIKRTYHLLVDKRWITMSKVPVSLWKTKWNNNVECPGQRQRWIWKSCLIKDPVWSVTSLRSSQLAIPTATPHLIAHLSHLASIYLLECWAHHQRTYPPPSRSQRWNGLANSDRIHAHLGTQWFSAGVCRVLPCMYSGGVSWRQHNGRGWRQRMCGSV